MFKVQRYKHGTTFIVFNSETRQIVLTPAGNYKLFRSLEAAQAAADKLNETH